MRPMQPQNSDTSGIHVIQSMENILSFLNRSWLGFGSTFLDTTSNYIFLSGVGSILLYLWYLILKSFFPPPWKSQNIKKVRMYDEPPRDIFTGILQNSMSTGLVLDEFVCLRDLTEMDGGERKEHCCPRTPVLAWENYRED